MSREYTRLRNNKILCAPEEVIGHAIQGHTVVCESTTHDERNKSYSWFLEFLGKSYASIKPRLGTRFEIKLGTGVIRFYTKGSLRLEGLLKSKKIAIYRGVIE